MFSPIQTAHGPEAMPSCPAAQKLPESTWSRSHGLQNSMTLMTLKIVN